MIPTVISAGFTWPNNWFNTKDLALASSINYYYPVILCNQVPCGGARLIKLPAKVHMLVRIGLCPCFMSLSTLIYLYYAWGEQDPGSLQSLSNRCCSFKHTFLLIILRAKLAYYKFDLLVFFLYSLLVQGFHSLVLFLNSISLIPIAL